jgi:hypothetical protein
MPSFTRFILASVLAGIPAAYAGHGSVHGAGHGHSVFSRRQDLVPRDSSVVGPISTLNIVNAEISPDGFTRSCVALPNPLCVFLTQYCAQRCPCERHLPRATHQYLERRIHCHQRRQQTHGPPYVEEHVDRKQTKIALHDDFIEIAFDSIGMDSSKRDATGSTVPHSSTNAPSRRATPSSTISRTSIKQVHIGTTRTCPRNTAMVYGARSWSTTCWTPICGCTTLTMVSQITVTLGMVS